MKGLARSWALALPLLAALGVASCHERPWPPDVQAVPDQSPPLPAEQALKTFHLPPGYRIELVASEPMVESPVAMDFDADGRLWVVEMRGYMPNLEARGEDEPVGRVVVLEDVDDDGRADRRTVYLDSLVLPRAIKVLEHGVLVAAPPYLWLTRDTTGDLRADTREVVRDDYGDPRSNPEHNANGLIWGLDNWIHSARYEGQLRLREDGSFAFREVPRLGQWGISIDEYGRIYRNYNEDPLHVDLVPPHYLARNPNLRRPRGIYEDVAGGNQPVWPVRPTPAVNRGYRDGILRPDGTLAKFTAAGAPVVYVGDRLPRELVGDVFVTESAGNLVRRFKVKENPDGTLSATNAYENAEFLASTDERFRPVNLYSAPDGTLYVLDMYHGMIQHRYFVTDYLAHQMRQRGLTGPEGQRFGRIYRIVHRSARRGEKPRLSQKTSAELVEYLSHPNGWWRLTAQRMIVERGDRSVAPALRRLALEAPDERARLHALWTLEGLGAADPETLRRALSDRSPQVRAAAIRIGEPYLAEAGHPLLAAVLERLDDPAPVVRWQLAASLGEVRGPQRDSLLAMVLARVGDDPIAVDAAVSGLRGRELAVLERLLRDPAFGKAEAVERLAAAVTAAGDRAGIARLAGWAGEEGRPGWQRLALLQGIRSSLPEAWRGGGRGRLEFDRPPAGLLAAAASPDSALRAAAEQILAVASWPGRPAPQRKAAEELSPEEARRFEAGREHYQAICASCHQPDGRGLPGVAAALAGSEWVLGRPDRLIRIVLHGKEGEMLMPPMGQQLTDEQIAAILTYIRRAWGNQASPVGPELVREVRGYTTGRDRPWTEEELRAARQ